MSRGDAAVRAVGWLRLATVGSLRRLPLGAGAVATIVLGTVAGAVQLGKARNTPR